MKHLFVIAVVIAAPVRARADAKAEAQQHIDKAMAHHQEGRFKEALAELMFAYSLDPRAELLYGIGQVHVKLGDCAQAITFYERFLTTRPEGGAATSAREAIDVCKTNPPTLPDPVPTTTEPTLPDPPPPAPIVEPIPARITTTTTRS